MDKDEVTAQSNLSRPADTLLPFGLSIALLESTTDAIIGKTLQGSITYWNPSAERIYGYSSEEMVGKHISLLIPPDYSHELPIILQKLERGEHILPFETVRVRKDGTRIRVSVCMSPICDISGNILGISIIARTITIEYQALEMLRLLGSAIQQSQESILITDANLDFPGPHIEFANPAFTRMTGYTLEEVKGKSPRIFQGPKTDRLMLDRLREHLARGDTFSGETINYRKDGTEFIMQWEIGPIQDDTGKVTHFVATQRDVTEQRAAEARRQHEVERTDALRTIDTSIITQDDLYPTLGLILDYVRGLLEIDAADILIFDPELQVLHYACGRGFRPGYTPPFAIHLEEDPAGLVARHRNMLTYADLGVNGVDFLRPPRFAGEGFTDYIALPLIVYGEIRGVLELFHREPLSPDPEWMAFLEVLAGQAAIALQNSTLLGDLARAQRELIISHDVTIEGWSRAIDLRDHETKGHSLRVTEMAARLSELMGVPEEERVHIRRGALLHDIGKLGVPDSILLKPGPLTEDEWEVMSRHPTYAYEMLLPITFLRPALAIPLCHHEKWDGTGYPNGLKGQEIPLAARIFAVVDIWDALRSDRPYRVGWPAEKVKQHIRAIAGSHLDPEVVEAFFRLELP